MNQTNSIDSIIIQLNYLCPEFNGKKFNEALHEGIGKKLEPLLSPIDLFYADSKIFHKPSHYPELFNTPIFKADFSYRVKDMKVISIVFEPVSQCNRNGTFQDYLKRIRKESIQRQITEYDAKISQMQQDIANEKENLRILMFRLQEIV